MEDVVISSRNNPLVKKICSLDDKKNRYSEGLFRFDGIKLFLECLSSGVEIERAIVRVPMSERVEALIKESGLDGEKIVLASESVFEKISGESSPEGIVTVARMCDSLHKVSTPEEAANSIESGERILILESLRDPGNLGTILRSSFSLGIEKVVMSSDCADIYNSKTLRSAMGAAFKLPTLRIDNKDMPRFILALREKGRRIYATALRKDAIYIGQAELSEGDCFVIGNEGHGLSEETVLSCDKAVIIPMTEGAESLNAAAAATICIWETVRHRVKPRRCEREEGR